MRTKDGWMTVTVKDLPIGAIVRVQPGEPISVDGHMFWKYGNRTTLTGEALPVVRNDLVPAGTWSVDGLLEIKVGVQAGRRDLDNLLQRVDEQEGTPSKLKRKQIV